MVIEVGDSSVNRSDHSETWQCLEEKIRTLLDNMKKKVKLLFNFLFFRHMMRKTEIGPDNNSFKRVFC